MVRKFFNEGVGRMQAMRQEDVWSYYNMTKDEKFREQLIESYLPLVKHVVSRMAISLPPYLDYQDLVSFGIFGLIQAIERYDSSRGIKFETYAYRRIRGSIIDEIKKMNWLPDSVRRKAKILQNAYEELQKSLGRTVKDEDICNYLKISMEELNDLYMQASYANVVSLEDMFNVDIVQRDRLNPEIIIEKDEAKKILSQAIERLPAQEKLVITLYYYEELTLKEISEVLKLSQARISQLHTKAIMRLRGSLSRKRDVFR